METATATVRATSVSWWALLVAGETILLALGIGIVLDAYGASLADAAAVHGVMLAAVIAFFGASAIFLMSWLGADEHGATSAEAARSWWKVPVVIAAEAIVVAAAAGVVWDYSATSPGLDPTVLQVVMLAGALIFVAAFAVCLTGVLRADERA